MSDHGGVPTQHAADVLTDAFGAPYSDTVVTDEIRKAATAQYITGVNPLESQLKDAERQASRPITVRGKPFEHLVCRSANYQRESVDIERFHDSDLNRNICDYLIQCENGMTAWVEVKTTSTSMPFHQQKPIVSKFKQQPLLLAKSIRCKTAGTRDKNMIGVLVEFKRKGIPYAVWWVDIDDISWLQDNLGKKSFNVRDLEAMYMVMETMNSFPLRMYKPARARKDYIDIKLMMNGNAIDGTTVQLEEA